MDVAAFFVPFAAGEPGNLFPASKLPESLYYSASFETAAGTKSELVLNLFNCQWLRNTAFQLIMLKTGIRNLSAMQNGSRYLRTLYPPTPLVV
jgi:hypothetical protein